MEAYIRRVLVFISQKSTTLSNLTQNPKPRRGFSSSRKFIPGLDYNHWMVTLDFPAKNRPNATKMIETYVETATKVLKSKEEAMKRIYACSTTTYTGFQIRVSKEVALKFKGLPLVMFVVPDMYIYPINKLYGGDTYKYGKITPTPRPTPRPPQQNYQNSPRGSMQQGQHQHHQKSMQHHEKFSRLTIVQLNSAYSTSFNQKYLLFLN